MILVVFAILTPFVFIPGLQDPSGLPKTFYLSLLAVGAIALLRKKEQFVIPWSLIVFIGAILLSGFWSINPHFFLSQLSLDLSGITLFLYAANCLKSKDLPVAMMILCLMGMVIALSVFVGIQIDPRVSGSGWSVVNEKFYTLLLAGLIPLAVGLWSIGGWATVFGTVSAIYMFTYIIWVPSVAANVSLLIISVSAFGFVAWELFKKQSWVMDLILITIIAVPLIAGLRAFSFFEPSALALRLNRIEERKVWWKESQTMLVKSNFLGVGRGQWQTQPHKRSPVHGFARSGWRPEHAHSDTMEILAETGVLGLGAFLVFLYVTLMLSTGRMGFWLKLSFLTFIFEGMFWSLLHYAIFEPFFWIIAGMIWADREEEKDIFSGAGY